MAWFQYEKMGSGLMPVIGVQLVPEWAADDWGSFQIKFLVDSGAAYSMVPQYYVMDLIRDRLHESERYIGIKGVSGGDLKGRLILFRMRIPNVGKLGEIVEPIWVCRNLTWPILGQTWFEKFGANFQNFPGGPNKRQFGLYKNPF